MEQFREVKKILKTRGIEIRKIKATLNGAQAYKVKGSKYNPAALWTAAQIRQVYSHGEF